MLERRLEYQSLKAVLLHMDANVRFQISLCMPSIRSVEKVVPLKMNTFFITDRSTVVNHTYYEVLVDRKYPNGNSPEGISIDWFRFDSDEFGFPLDFGADVLLPGDVSFQQGNQQQERFDTEEYERMYRHDLRHYEKALEKLQELNSRGVTIEEHLKSLENVPLESDEDREVRQILHRDSRDLVSSIEGCKFTLLSFDCRRNNTKPSFDCYIQLAITEGESSRSKLFEANRRLFEASKYLNDVLFGGRTMPIRVGEFTLSDDFIIRLPVGFRLQVQKALPCGNSICHKSFPLIVENSEQLNILEISSWQLLPAAYEGRIVRNARRLILDDIEEEDEFETLVQVIRDLPNPEICIRPNPPTHSIEIYFLIIQAWLRRDRQVGASLWMRTWGEKLANDVMESIRTHCEESNKAEISTSVDMSESANWEFLDFPEKSWMIKINIVNV